MSVHKLSLQLSHPGLLPPDWKRRKAASSANPVYPCLCPQHAVAGQTGQATDMHIGPPPVAGGAGFWAPTLPPPPENGCRRSGPG